MLRTPMLLALILASLYTPHARAQTATQTPKEQGAIDPRCFFVEDYKNVVAADFVMMRKLGIWDDVEAGALKVALSLAEKELGFSFEAVDRFTMTMAFPKDGAQGEQARILRMAVFDGNQELPIGDGMLETMSPQDHGRHTLYVREWDEEAGFVRAGKNVQVIGDVNVLKQALDGQRKPGLPCSDVMSLAAGKGKRLAHMVMDMSARAARRTIFEGLLKGTTWPADDMPTFAAARLLATGDEDDLHLVLEGTLRHAKVGDGLKTSEAAIDALLKRGLEMPQLRIFRKILKSAEKSTSGSDVIVRVDLGRSRHAVGNLSMILAPLFMIGVETAEAVQLQEVQLQAGEIEIVEPPPPPPPEPKPSGGGGQTA